MKKKYAAYYPLIFLTISLITVLVVRARLNEKLAHMQAAAKAQESATAPENAPR